MGITNIVIFAFTCMFSTVHCNEQEFIEFVVNFEGTQTVELKFKPMDFGDTEGKCKEQKKPQWCPTLVDRVATFNPKFPEEKATVVFKGDKSEEYYVTLQQPKELPASSSVTVHCKTGEVVDQEVEAGFNIMDGKDVCPGDPANEVKCIRNIVFPSKVKFTGNCKAISYTLKGAVTKGKQPSITVEFMEIGTEINKTTASTAVSTTTEGGKDFSTSEEPENLRETTTTSVGFTNKFSAKILTLVLLFIASY